MLKKTKCLLILGSALILTSGLAQAQTDADTTDTNGTQNNVKYGKYDFNPDWNVDFDEVLSKFMVALGGRESCELHARYIGIPRAEKIGPWIYLEGGPNYDFRYPFDSGESAEGRLSLLSGCSWEGEGDSLEYSFYTEAQIPVGEKVRKQAFGYDVSFVDRYAGQIAVALESRSYETEVQSVSMTEDYVEVRFRETRPLFDRETENLDAILKIWFDINLKTDIVYLDPENGEEILNVNVAGNSRPRP